MTDQLARVENDGPSRGGLDFDGLSWRGRCGQSAVHVVCRWLDLARMFPRLPFSHPQRHSAGTYKVMRWRSHWRVASGRQRSVSTTLWMTTSNKHWLHPELRQPHRRWQPQGSVLVPQVSRRPTAVTCAWSLHARLCTLIFQLHYTVFKDYT